MEFKRELKLFDAVMLVTGTMIGSGIFIVSSEMALHLGNSIWLILAWLFTGVITVFAALCYGELAGMFPGAGGQYIYLKEAYGSLVAFLYGWTFFLVIQTGTIAAVGMAFAKFLAVLLPYPPQFFSWIAISITVLLTYLNMQGIKNGKWVQNIFGVAKIGAIIILVVVGFSIGFSNEVWNHNSSAGWEVKRTFINSAGTVSSISSVHGLGIITVLGLAMVGSMFSSDAWNNVTFSGDEIVNPTRTLPMALILGTVIVTIIYILVNVVYIGTVPLWGSPNSNDIRELGMQFSPEGRVAISSAVLTGGKSMSAVIALLILVSTFGCQNGCILSGARVYYSMAKDKLFFPALGHLNSKSVPAKALIIQCVWASILCLSGTYSNLLDYVMFAVVLFYILTVAGIFILRIKKPTLYRPYKTPLYPILPIIYIVLASVFIYILFTEKQAYTLPGLIIITSGVPMYFLFRKLFVKNII